MCLIIKETEKNRKHHYAVRSAISNKKKYSHLLRELGKIAKKDIPVFKVLKVLPDGKLCTPVMHTKFKLGHVYTSRLAMETGMSTGKIRIGRGLHSAKTLECAEDIGDGWGTCVILHAVIPKGTFHIVGSSGDVVSEALKVHDDDRNHKKISNYQKRR